MVSDVYTKSEILQTLASKGYFIDSYTLDTFFKKWKVEAIFEDEQGSEFYDKNTLDLVLSNLFKKQMEEEQQASKDILIPEKVEPKPAPPPVQPQVIVVQQQAAQKRPVIDDEVTSDILKNISLSDGTPLINKVPDIPIPTDDFGINDTFSDFDFSATQKPKEVKKEKKIGILEGAMKSYNPEFLPEDKKEEDIQENQETEYDDISLLSESLEAQEKFKEYVISEMQKKNADFTIPQSNEFKLDISERTLTMIAKSMAKKIAKYVGTIYSQDAKSTVKLASVEEENKKLEEQNKKLEEQNKKLRLLLTESNKNLNSYKPSLFGLYKKVPPGK